MGTTTVPEMAALGRARPQVHSRALTPWLSCTPVDGPLQARLRHAARGTPRAPRTAAPGWEPSRCIDPCMQSLLHAHLVRIAISLGQSVIAGIVDEAATATGPLTFRTITHGAAAGLLTGLTTLW